MSNATPPGSGELSDAGPAGTSEAAPASARRLEPDLLKAGGILAVVLIHSLRAPFTPGVSRAELWLGGVTRFAVPGFLLASGFLYATRSRVPAATTVRRLRRILGPYLVASVAAQVFHLVAGERRPASEGLRELLLASSFGPYYYVWIALFVVLCAPVLARVGPRALVGILVASLAGQGWLESAPIEGAALFWQLRNPLRWLAYFVCGWALRLHESRLRAGLTPLRRNLLLLGTGVGVVLGSFARALGEPSAWTYTAIWLGIWATLALLLAASFGRPTRSAWVRRLSDVSYAIYLFHLFFAIPVVDAMHPDRGRFEPLAVLLPWAAGLVGSALLIGIARRLLGAERSRTWLGA